MKKFLLGVLVVAVLVSFAQPVFTAAKKKADAAAHYSESEIPSVVAELKQRVHPAQLRVMQVIEGGILARGSLESEGRSYELREPIFVHCKTGGLADGDRFETDLFEIGIMRYKTALGGLKSVHSYSDSVEDAARKIRRADLPLPARGGNAEPVREPAVSELGRVGGNFGSR